MTNSSVCIDASFLIRLLESGSEKHPVVGLWRKWHESRRSIVAPTLLYYEVANALYRYTLHGDLPAEQAIAALEIALSLDIVLHGDAALHLRAIEIATQFGLAATYDAHYLALAERFEAEFWTADRRLVRAVGQTLPWVNELPVERAAHR